MLSIHFAFWNHNAFFVVKSVFILLVKKNKHVQSRLNMWPLSMCLTNQTVRMTEIPIMWHPIFGKLMTTAITWANGYFLNMQSHSKLRRILSKLVTSREDSLQPKHNRLSCLLKWLTNCFCFSPLTGQYLAGHPHPQKWKDVN